MEAQGGILVEEKERTYRDQEASSPGPGRETGEGRPDPEVTEMPTRRKFTAEYKLRILAEVDACTHPGEVGALLRREGLYSSHLTRWRKKRRAGALGALAPEKRGPKPAPENPFTKRVAELERECARLRKKLEAAETIIEIQKKVSGLLGINSEAEGSEEKR
jgi:transposase-like protein